MTNMNLAITSQLSNLGMAASAAYSNRDVPALSKVETLLNGVTETARKMRLDIGEVNMAVIQLFWTRVMLGSLLNDLAPHGGDRTQQADHTLKSLGIDPKDSPTWRRYAEIDPEDARVFFAEAANDGKEINLAYLLRLQTESETEPKSTAEIVADIFRRIGRLCDEGVGTFGICERDRQRLKMIKGITEDNDG